MLGRRRIGIVALIAACLIATPALAEWPFDGFKATCLDTQGDLDRAISIVEGEGWTSVSAELEASFAANHSADSVRSRIIRYGSDIFVLSTGVARRVSDGFAFEERICSVLGLDLSESPDSVEAFADWAGQPIPEPSSDGRRIWVFEVVDGQISEISLDRSRPKSAVLVSEGPDRFEYQAIFRRAADQP